MINFGTSAFLRIVHLNDRPQRTQLRKRSKPSGGGYDFHNSLRRLATQLLFEGVPLDAVLADADAIARESERKSAKQALERLSEWKRKHAGSIAMFESVRFDSPEELFAVTFTSNFGLEISGERVAIHLWNTKNPELESGLVRGVLSLFVGPYATLAHRPDDIAVLCLRTMRLIRLGSAVDATKVGQLLVTRVTSILKRIADEDKAPPSSPDRPTPPAPSK